MYSVHFEMYGGEGAGAMGRAKPAMASEASRSQRGGSRCVAPEVGARRWDSGDGAPEVGLQGWVSRVGSYLSSQIVH